MRNSYERSADVLFIRERFTELAAIAWHGYEQNGRGFLLIHTDNPQYFPANKDTLNAQGSILAGTAKAVYVPLTALQQCGADYPTENLEELVTGYDVRREIVVLIEREDNSGWRNYRFVGSMLPRDAHSMLKNEIQRIM